MTRDVVFITKFFREILNAKFSIPIDSFHNNHK